MVVIGYKPKIRVVYSFAASGVEFRASTRLY